MELKEIIEKLDNLLKREDNFNIKEILIEDDYILVVTEDDGNFKY